MDISSEGNKVDIRTKASAVQKQLLSVGTIWSFASNYPKIRPKDGYEEVATEFHECLLQLSTHTQLGRHPHVDGVWRAREGG
jgi:hypothetical protein